MSLSGKRYNDNAQIFSSKKNTDEYVYSAIARNIQFVKQFVFLQRKSTLLKSKK